MANKNFVVHNGLTVGALSVDAASGDLTTSGNIILTGSGSLTASAPASSLTGDTLASGVTKSSLTQVGTITTGVWNGSVIQPTYIATLNQNTTGSAASLTTPRNINGVAFDGTSSITITAAAGTLTGTTLNANIVNSSLTSVGTLGSLSVTGNVTAGGFSGPHYGSGAGLTSIPNSALNNSSITVNGTSVSLGGTATVTAAAATLTGDTLSSGVTKSSLTQVGTIDTGVWNGSAIQNTYLANSSLTINGTSVSLGGTATVTANAATLTGTTLKSTVVASSLTSVGNLTSLSASGNITTTGSVIAASFIGDGSNLTNVPAGALAGTASSINVSGTATVGNLLVTNKVNGDLIPSANITYTLGDRTHQWKDLFVGPGSIYVNGQKVLEQASDTIVFSADPNQNIAIRTLGTGDIQINPANTGIIAFKGAVQFDDAYNFVTTSGGPVPFTTGLKVPNITAAGTNATLTLAGTGTGYISLNDDVTVTGNLTVNGTTTALNVNNLNVQDNIVNISNGTTGTPTLNAGIQVMRGDEPNVQFRWNESLDKWQFTNDGSTYANLVAGTDITTVGTLGSLSVTGNVTAGGFSGAHYGSGAGLTSIPNSALTNSSITVNGTSVSLGGTATVTANAATLTGTTLNSTIVNSSLTSVGTIATGVWNGSAIQNAYLANSSLTINGTAISLGGTATVTAAAGTLTGTTLKSTVVNSSLTSVGTLGSLTVTGAATVGSVVAGNISISATADAITSTNDTITIDPASTGAGGTVVIQGNLQVTGTTTTVNSTIVEISDLNLTLAKDAATAAAANGAGLTVAGANATFNYASTGDKWAANKPLDVTGNVTATAFSGSGAYLTAIPNSALTNSSITVNGSAVSLGGSATVTAAAGTLTGTTLNASIVNSSLTSVGTIATGTWQGSVIQPAYIATLNQNTTGSAASLTTSRNINGVAFDGTADITVTANAATLSGTTLKSTVVNSSLTSVGTLGSLSVTGNVTAGGFSGPHYGSGAGLTSIPNGALTNSSITVNGSAISLGGSATVTANAATLTGTTLNATVVASSLTSVGNITSGTWSGSVIQPAYIATLNQNTTGSAASLTTSRNINGVAFNGTADITVTANAATLTGTTLASGVTASSLTSVGNLTSLSASGNISTTGNVVAAKFYGDGSNLTSIPASALSGTASSITVSGAATVGSVVAGNISISATADAITSSGTLTLDPNPTGSGGLVVIQGNLQVTGTTTTVNSTTVEVADLNITLAKDAATAAAANGAGLTVAGASATFNYASTGDKWTSNKPLDVTGNVTATAFSGSGAYLTSIPNGALTNSSITVNGSAISLGGSATVTANAATLTGTTLNATVVASSLTSVGNITSGTWSGSVIQPSYIATLNQNTTGSAASLTTSRNINGVAFNGTADITVTAAAGTLTGATLASGVTASSLTSVGTLSALTVSGAITVNSGNNATAIVNGGTNGTGNIGASGQTFNTIFAKATTAQYADLAEKYAADAEYEPGTVLCFGGSAEVTVCDHDADRKVAGVVTTNPAYMMNDAIEAEHSAAIALQGRVPCKVVGPVAKGDMLVSAGAGRARAEADPKVGSVIGKALEAHAEGEGVIEVAVGRF